MVVVKCEYCDNEIKRSPCAINNRQHVFCSHECRVKYYYGKDMKASFPDFYILGINILKLKRNRNGNKNE